MILPRPVRIRIAVVAALFVVPLLVLSVCGILYLRQHLAWYLYLPPLWGSMLAGYWLAGVPAAWLGPPMSEPSAALSIALVSRRLGFDPA